MKIKFFDKLRKKIWYSDELSDYEVWDMVLDTETYITMFPIGDKDKKDTEIFDGDIITSVVLGTDIPIGQLWKVFYNKERFAFYCTNGEIEKPFWEFKLDNAEYIVVGNIHQYFEPLESVEEDLQF